MIDIITNISDIITAFIVLFIIIDVKAFIVLITKHFKKFSDTTCQYDCSIKTVSETNNAQS